MSIQFGCAMGFELSTSVGFYFTSSSIGTGGSISIGAGGRNSSNGLLVTVGSDRNSSDGNVFVKKTLPTALSHPRICFPFTLNALPPAGATNQHFIICGFQDVGANQVDLRLRPDGKFIVTRNGTQIGPASTYIYTVNTFPHFEWDVLIDNSGSFDLLVNGASAFGGAQTGLDTQNTANANASEFLLGLVMTTTLTNTVTSHTIKFDDVLVDNANTNGDCRVREQLPTGTGTTDQGVPTGAADSRQAVDEAPPDNATSFTSLQNVNDEFLLTYATIPENEQVIAVGGRAVASKSAAGTATFKYRFRISGTEYSPGSDQAPNNGSYSDFPEMFMVSPATSSAWGTSEVNSMEMGVRKTS